MTRLPILMGLASKYSILSMTYDSFPMIISHNYFLGHFHIIDLQTEQTILKSCRFVVRTLSLKILPVTILYKRGLRTNMWISRKLTQIKWLLNDKIMMIVFSVSTVFKQIHNHILQTDFNYRLSCCSNLIFTAWSNAHPFDKYLAFFLHQGWIRFGIPAHLPI